MFVCLISSQNIPAGKQKKVSHPSCKVFAAVPNRQLFQTNKFGMVAGTAHMTFCCRASGE
jgi:hypothetical protein